MPVYEVIAQRQFHVEALSSGECMDCVAVRLEPTPESIEQKLKIELFAKEAKRLFIGDAVVLTLYKLLDDTQGPDREAVQ